MCGRFTLKTPADVLASIFDLETAQAWPPRYNIAPTQEAAVISNWDDRSLQRMRWGLIPRWAESAAEGGKHINARSETVASRALFRDSYQRRRCLVLADGFYEWKGTGKSKTPMYITFGHGKPFAFAGVWDGWLSPEGELVRSFTILTQPASRALRDVHHRMPVIVDRRQWSRWLAPGRQEPAELTSALASPADELFALHSVSPLVNSAKNDSPECIAPCDPAGTLPLFPDW